MKMHKSVAVPIKGGVVTCLLYAVLFANGNFQSSQGGAGLAIKEFFGIIHDSQTQWMIFLCLGIYLFFLFYCCSGSVHEVWRGANPDLWLFCTFVVSVVFYAIDYSASTAALTLLVGAVLGHGLAAWSSFEARKPQPSIGNHGVILIVLLLVVLLACASISDGDLDPRYQYQLHARWVGPWDNPNLFGLLMGTGVVLTLGVGLGRWRAIDTRSEIMINRLNWKADGYLFVILCFLLTIVFLDGLVNSYSRGAWFATISGVVFLVGSRLWAPGLSSATKNLFSHSGRGIRKAKHRLFLWLKVNWLPSGIILTSLLAMVLCYFQQTDWHPARRAISAINPVDFSWRNRVTAWEGAWQIMAEHSWFGTGWNQSELLYEHYYLPAKMNESAAFQLNDYLLLGATLGLPTLFCFGMYLWLSLTRKGRARHYVHSELQQEAGVDGIEVAQVSVITSAETTNRPLEASGAPSVTLNCQDVKPWEPDAFPIDWIQTICRAGAIVLLVGFWFDGGLFKLPTAATFWILLELGNVSRNEIHAPHENG